MAIVLVLGCAVSMQCTGRSEVPHAGGNADRVDARETKSADEASQGANMLSEDQARAIAHEFFQRPPQAGVYAEDRGDYWFAAPPIKTRVHLEKQGILIDKRTRRIYTPAQVPGAPFSKDKGGPGSPGKSVDSE
jgi:hypothetical protein